MDPMFCLIGKFFTSFFPPSIDQIKTSIQSTWNFSGAMTVSSFEKDLIFFNFELEIDMRMVLDSTCYVDGFTLVLKEWPLQGSISDIDFSVAWMWVKIEGLPLTLYTEAESERIGKRLSDKPLANTYINPSKRSFFVRAEIDLKKPLAPGFFIGRRRKHFFVQFKYKNLGRFCYRCGMIDHRFCAQRIPKERSLTRKFKTHIYGPWLRYLLHREDHELLIKFPEKISDETEDEKTVPYEQFFIKLRVDVVYTNEHEWGGKKLSRSISDAVHEHRFRFPCSYLSTTLESNDEAQTCQILARQIDENVPLVGLTFDDKVNIVQKFVEYARKNEKIWTFRKWVPIRICAKKIIRLSCVDFGTKFQVRKDDKFYQMIDHKMSKMIRRRVENNEDITSLPLWNTCIQDLFAQVGLKEIPFSVTHTAIKARRDAIEYGIMYHNGPGPADRTSVLELERVKVRGHDMDSLEPCAICHEGIFLGDEGTRMPCSHLFHSVCIQEWLQKGNQCPLCRYQLPPQKRIAFSTAASHRYNRLKREFL